MTEKKAREWGSGSYTTYVWAIEARAAFGTIVLAVDDDKFGFGQNPVANKVLTPDTWTRIPAARAHIGVPNRLGSLYSEAAANGFMSYQCAMAIACWFQAQYEHAETRLVQIEFNSSYSTREIGTTCSLNLYEDSRAILWALRDGKGPVTRELAPAADAVDPHVGGKSE